MEFSSPTFEVYTLGYFQAKLCYENCSVGPHIFTMGENKDGRKRGQFLKTETVHLH